MDEKKPIGDGATANSLHLLPDRLTILSTYPPIFPFFFPLQNMCDTFRVWNNSSLPTGQPLRGISRKNLALTGRFTRENLGRRDIWESMLVEQKG
ncbi:MAG: hypothetical protein AAF633_04055 [Chloroflexota bacterium]